MPDDRTKGWATEQINQQFLNAGLSPIYTTRKLHDALANRIYGYRNRKKGQIPQSWTTDARAQRRQYQQTRGHDQPANSASDGILDRRVAGAATSGAAAAAASAKAAAKATALDLANRSNFELHLHFELAIPFTECSSTSSDIASSNILDNMDWLPEIKDTSSSDSDTSGADEERRRRAAGESPSPPPPSSPPPSPRPSPWPSPRPERLSHLHRYTYNSNHKHPKVFPEQQPELLAEKLSLAKLPQFPEPLPSDDSMAALEESPSMTSDYGMQMMCD